MAIRAFLSFVEEDLNLVNLFRGQAKNQNSELEFHDYSIKVPYNSTNEAYIGRNIAQQINLCTVSVCLYGPTTYKSAWVDWELKRTLQFGKPIMGVRLYPAALITYYPRALKGWPIMDWNVTAIVREMGALAARYRGVR